MWAKLRLTLQEGGKIKSSEPELWLRLVREAPGRVRVDTGVVQGDQITPELTALRLLGGGSAYEAYLAFDDVTAAAYAAHGV